jgi:hypothetical protein
MGVLGQKSSAVLDGEIVCLDEDGKPQFRDLLVSHITGLRNDICRCHRHIGVMACDQYPRPLDAFGLPDKFVVVELVRQGRIPNLVGCSHIRRIAGNLQAEGSGTAHGRREEPVGSESAN